MNNDQDILGRHGRIKDDVIERNFTSVVSEAARRLRLNRQSPQPRGNGLVLCNIAYEYGVSLVALGRALQRRRTLKQRGAASSAGRKQLRIWE